MTNEEHTSKCSTNKQSYIIEKGYFKNILKFNKATLEHVGVNQIPRTTI